MSAEGIVLVVGAVSAQLLTPVLAYLKVARSVGVKNGAGTVHEQLACVSRKLDQVFSRLDALERKS